MIDPLGFCGDRPGRRPSTPIPSAHRPWLDGERPMEPYQGAEPQEKIERCLSCTVPKRLCKGAGKGCGRRKDKKL